MNYPLVSTLVLPAIISFIISYLTNKKQKELEVIFDYRKYIIDRRKEAYQAVEDFIKITNYVLGEFNATFIKFPTVDALKSTNEKAIAIREQHKIWISPGLKDAFWSYVLNMDSFIASFSKLNEAQRAEKQFTNMQLALYRLHQIEDIYFIDIMELDDVKSFKEKKKQQHTDQIKDLLDVMGVK
jgi:hypothetical protein